MSEPADRRASRRLQDAIARSDAAPRTELDVVDAITDQTALSDGGAVGIDRPGAARARRSSMIRRRLTVVNVSGITMSRRPGFAFECADGALDVIGLVNRHHHRGHCRRRRRGLERTQIIFGKRRRLRVEHESGMGETRDDLLQKLQPLSRSGTLRG